jgi:hypothetical protein
LSRSAQTFSTRTLLAFRWRSLGRRMRGVQLFVAIVVAVFALGALALLGHTLAAAGADETVVRDQVFWLGVVAALVYSYTTFEVFFRAKDSRFLATLPLSGAHRFDDLFVRAALLHLPLALPVVAYALALLLSNDS